MRRQTSTGGANLAGSSRALRLDPQFLPLSFEAHDSRADGSIRRIELHRERVVLRRAVAGMRMAINLRVSDYLGLALREANDTRVLTLIHRDPALSIPLCISSDHDLVQSACEHWSAAFALPVLPERETREPASRRRRRSAVSTRRPRFLVRRRAGAPLSALHCHAGEREIIARD